MSSKTARWLNEIKGKLSAEGVTSLSDESIEKALSGCVASYELIKLAKKYRDDGILRIYELPKHNEEIDEEIEIPEWLKEVRGMIAEVEKREVRLRGMGMAMKELAAQSKRNGVI